MRTPKQSRVIQRNYTKNRSAKNRKRTQDPGNKVGKSKPNSWAENQLPLGIKVLEGDGKIPNREYTKQKINEQATFPETWV